MSTDFGRDTSCTTSLRTGRFVSGVRLVAEAGYRRITTPRGMLRGGEAEKNYGLDITEEIGKVGAKNAAASLPARLSSELGKDERIQKVDVSIFSTTSSEGLVSLDVTIDGHTAEGPFQLKLRASAVTVTLLGITAGG